MASTSTTPDTPRTRPRVEGDREREILRAALAVLVEAGYEKMTFDAVASAAKASKATLYRRWAGKVDLVVDALQLIIGVEADRYPDTGSLRGDLVAQAEAKGGIGDDRTVQLFTTLLAAIHRDEELHTAIRTRVLQPKLAAAERVFLAARDRGEVGKDADLTLLARLLPAICIHEFMLTGASPSPEHITTLVDTVVLPACAATLPRD
jgi:AcrR family transcriptional regulator